MAAPHVKLDRLGGDEDLRAVTGVELDRRVHAGAEVWEELLDALTASGMLPSRELAGRVVAFLEDQYWRAEDARIEALRRHVFDEAARLDGRHAPGWGLCGR